MDHQPGIKVFGLVVVRRIDPLPVQELDIIIQDVVVPHLKQAPVNLDAQVPPVLVTDGVHQAVTGVPFSGQQCVHHLRAFHQFEVTVLGQVLQGELHDLLPRLYIKERKGLYCI